MADIDHSSSSETVSVIIRTYNEARYLEELLTAIEHQKTDGFDVEIVVVDSGSSDATLDIVAKHEVTLIGIKKADFTFGRSLNEGCGAASGSIYVMISGHCVPVGISWLSKLVDPIRKGIVQCSYGRQIGRDTTKFSENQLLLKYFPLYSKIDQNDFFCNNANAAVSRKTWTEYKYNEELTGLEDMFLGKQILAGGGKIGYVADSVVYHIHDESWKQVRVRYEREALALQRIMPNVHFGLFDFLSYVTAAIFSDIATALKDGVFVKNAVSIFKFRVMQYWGTYKGARRHKLISEATKRSYFYPKDLEKFKYVKDEDRRIVAHEGKQRAG